jgi:hypothetical protein
MLLDGNDRASFIPNDFATSPHIPYSSYQVQSDSANRCAEPKYPVPYPDTRNKLRRIAQEAGKGTSSYGKYNHSNKLDGSSEKNCFPKSYALKFIEPLNAHLTSKTLNKYFFL